jgi:DNA-directed RNA polymerase specialized sigma24 family protein
MRAVIVGTKRETLLQEIYNAFLQWPELERRIFSQAHYHGQSPEAISRSFQLDVEEVRATLKQCERRLYASLM